MSVYRGYWVLAQMNAIKGSTVGYL